MVNINHAPLITQADLVEAFRDLGLTKGMSILVEAECSQIGYVYGNEQTIIDALFEVIGYEGNIVVPTFTYNELDPSNQEQKLYRQNWAMMRSAKKSFDLKLSAPNDSFAAQFLRNEGVVRSYHPIHSFAAWGKYARIICDQHPLHFALNHDSPLGKIVDFHGSTLLIGVPCSKCTLLQLAKYENQDEVIRVWSASIAQHKRVIHKDMLDIANTDEDFYQIEDVLRDKGLLGQGYCGNATIQLIPAKECVQIASAYVKNPRNK